MSCPSLEARDAVVLSRLKHGTNAANLLASHVLRSRCMIVARQRQVPSQTTLQAVRLRYHHTCTCCAGVEPVVRRHASKPADGHHHRARRHTAEWADFRGGRLPACRGAPLVSGVADTERSTLVMTQGKHAVKESVAGACSVAVPPTLCNVAAECLCHRRWLAPLTELRRS